MESSETPKTSAFLEYIYELNEGKTLTEALQQSLDDVNQIDMAHLNNIGFRTYQTGKWTIHQILQHLIDWERIWCFRAVLFARQEGTIPDAHDQEIMVDNSHANDRSIEELVDELRLVRQSSIVLFESFRKDLLELSCRFFEYEMPLSALGLAITTHQIHHFRVIQERYSHLAE